MAKHGDTKQRAAMAEREHRRNKRILRLLCFVVAIAVAFVAGFALRSQDQFLVSLGFSIPGVQKAGTQSTDVKKSPYDSISARLSEVEDVLAKSDLNGYDLDEATKEVFKGFSSACDDKYFEYLDPSRYASFVKDSSDGAYNGVGVLFSDYNGRALVSDVFSEPLPRRPASSRATCLSASTATPRMTGRSPRLSAVFLATRARRSWSRGCGPPRLVPRRAVLHHRAHVLFVQGAKRHVLARRHGRLHQGAPDHAGHRRQCLCSACRPDRSGSDVVRRGFARQSGWLSHASGRCGEPLYQDRRHRRGADFHGHVPEVSFRKDGY